MSLCMRSKIQVEMAAKSIALKSPCSLSIGGDVRVGIVVDTQKLLLLLWLVPSDRRPGHSLHRRGIEPDPFPLLCGGNVLPPIDQPCLVVNRVAVCASLYRPGWTQEEPVHMFLGASQELDEER